MREKYGSREGEGRFVCLRRPSDAQGHGLSPPPSSMLCLDGAFYPSLPSYHPPTPAPRIVILRHLANPLHPLPPLHQLLTLFTRLLENTVRLNTLVAASPRIEGDGVLLFFFFSFFLFGFLFHFVD